MTDDLLTQIHALHDELQRKMRARFDRDLPFEELVFDRWERATRLGFGDGASIYHNSYVMGDVRVGQGTWVGPLVMLDGLHASVEIGNHCSISTGVQVYTHDTVKWALSGGIAGFEVGPVRIGDCTYIGSQSVVLRGVSIGDHCVVGAQSLVNRDIEPYSIALGAPARVRGRVAVTASGEVELDLD
jgi:acetyltransferase-like isoleucine patch superfamily enzyme